MGEIHMSLIKSLGIKVYGKQEWVEIAREKMDQETAKTIKSLSVIKNSFGHLVVVMEFYGSGGSSPKAFFNLEQGSSVGLGDTIDDPMRCTIIIKKNSITHAQSNNILVIQYYLLSKRGISSLSFYFFLPSA